MEKNLNSYLKILHGLDPDSCNFQDCYQAHRKIRALSSGRITSPHTSGLKIAIIGSYPPEFLHPCLDIIIRLNNLEPDFYLGDYNLYQQEILDPSSRLYRWRPDIILLTLDTANCFGKHLLGRGTARRKVFRAAAEELIELIDFCLEETHHPTLIVNNFSLLPSSRAETAAGNKNNDLKTLINTTNRRLRKYYLDQPRVLILDLDEVLARYGKNAAYDPRLYYLARVPFSHDFFPVLAREYMPCILSLMGLSRKVLVLDTDNVLWGGIVGETGMSNIELGDSPAGEALVDFQKHILSLHRQGVILAINSKNNPADVLEVFHRHPRMVLKENMFAVMKINWQDKVKNMKEIAQELNLNLDTFVFIDDNPVERELVSSLLPQVMVPALPLDPFYYPQFISNLRLFNQAPVTAEDRKRNRLYRQRRKAEALRKRSISLPDYLRRLRMKAIIRPTGETSLNRVAQLFQRTNQFNLTGKRHNFSALRRFLNSKKFRLWELELLDRFGNNGIVASALIKIGDGKKATIDSFLMSCRVIGRSVEDSFLAFIAENCFKSGLKIVVGHYILTPKNAPARDFYPRNGFILRARKGNEYFYEFTPGKKKIHPPKWIELIHESGRST